MSMNALIRALQAAAGAAALCMATAAMAAYPEKPIKLIAPYAPGGIADSFARAVADGVGRELKQPVIVDNKPGAGAMVGTGIAASSPADGYTLVVASNGNMVITPLVTKKLTYDPLKELRVIAVIGEIPTVVVTNLQTPASDLRAFANFAKANPGKVNFASLGQGNVTFLTAKKIETELGVRMTEVPYKGSIPAITGLMGNEVQLYVDVLTGALPFIQGGKLKALAVPSDKRLPWLPDVPTLQEAGYANFHAVSWIGIAVPTATPPQIVTTLQGAIAKVARDEHFRTTFTRMGVVMLQPVEPAQVDEYVKKDRERWGALIKEHNISID